MMRLRDGLLWLVGSASVVAMAGAGPLPPGRQHRLVIEGEHSVNFLPQSGLPPLKIEYRARVEYIVDTRLGKETKAQAEDTPGEDVPKEDVPKEDVPAKKPAPRKAGSSTKARAKASDNPSKRVTGAVDLSIHSSEILYRQNGQPILETRMSRSRFQGRLQPEAPVLNVSANEAPLRLQEILKLFDSTGAILQVNDDFRVVDRKFRSEGPQRAMLETLASIHAPMPKEGDSWESSSRLAMGHSQTAKGTLRFEKETKGDPKPGGAIRVKVSGVLKGEGVIAGNFIKDGTYTVTGDQAFDPKTREWTSSRWLVVVSNDLANQAGMIVAQAKGKMTVESRAVDAPGDPASPGAEPKL